MRKIFVQNWKLILLSLAFSSSLFLSCKPLIAKYDPYSYTQNSAIKVEVLNIAGKTATNYSSIQAEIEAVLLKVEKIKEYDSHKPNNQIMATMWVILWNRLQSTKTEGTPPQKIGFFSLWKDNTTISPAFAKEAKDQIEEIYNCLLDLESKKVKEEEASKLIEKFKQFLNN